jgi:heme A synthase
MNLSTHLYFTNAILAGCVLTMIIAINQPKHAAKIATGLICAGAATLILGVGLVIKFPQFREPYGFFNSGAIAILLALAGQALQKFFKGNQASA